MPGHSVHAPAYSGPFPPGRLESKRINDKPAVLQSAHVSTRARRDLSFAQSAATAVQAANAAGGRLAHRKTATVLRCGWKTTKEKAEDGRRTAEKNMMRQKLELRGEIAHAAPGCLLRQRAQLLTKPASRMYGRDESDRERECHVQLPSASRRAALSRHAQRFQGRPSARTTQSSLPRQT